MPSLYLSFLCLVVKSFNPPRAANTRVNFICGKPRVKAFSRCVLPVLTYSAETYPYNPYKNISKEISNNRKENGKINGRFNLVRDYQIKSYIEKPG